jgi:hypothetical protein
MQEPQTRITPPLRRAPPGQQTGIRQADPEGLARTPGFDAVSEFRRLNSARPTRSPRPSASGTSSWSPPDAITTAPFPDRSPRRSSANAASGGLAPAPVGRRWRANKPPSLAQLRLYRGLLHDSSFSVRDTQRASYRRAVGRAVWVIPSGGCGSSEAPARERSLRNRRRGQRRLAGAGVVARRTFQSRSRAVLARLEPLVGACGLSSAGGAAVTTIPSLLSAYLAPDVIGGQDLSGGVCPAVAMRWSGGAAQQRPGRWDGPVAGDPGEDRA